MVHTDERSRGLTYRDDGVEIVGQVIDARLVAAAAAHMDLVIDGEYETDVEPIHFGVPDRSRLVKIDQPHWADRTIREAVSSPEMGRRVAEVLGASLVQVWGVQLLYKPPAREETSVGWHQDLNYWHTWWEGEVFTAWLALSDVTAEAGPVLFVTGSHGWDMQPGGDFFNNDLARVKEGLALPEDAVWNEAPAILPPGHASIHHKRVIHGSRPNLSTSPRRGLAIHLRTEKSRPLATGDPVYVGHLDDPERAPIIFES